jgi:hypothetical protein
MIKTLGNYKFKIDEESPFTVHIWGEHNSDLNGPEMCLQSSNPNSNNEVWIDAATAEAWAIQTIKDLENPQSITPTVPTSQEIQAAQAILVASGFTVTAPIN